MAMLILKNFSAMQSEQGDYVLTPAYDLLCTRMHSPSESDMAISLFKDRFTKTYEAYGFYTYQDFLEFGQHMGIKESQGEADDPGICKLKRWHSAAY
jgi:serine/threonine-protein kinase HipA